MDLFSLKNKTAIVTGALGLIGKKHCEALALAGANVVVADRDKKACENFAKALGINHLGIKMDVTNESDLKENRAIILKKYKTIDILVNNAAINEMFENPAMAAHLSAFENYPVEAFRMSLDVNVTGVFLCAQVFGSVMAEQGSGSIINIASTYGIVGPDQNIYKKAVDEGNPDNGGKGVQTFYKSAAYPTTKGAVVNFTRFLAAYWGHKGVRVNTLSPGGVENGQDEFFYKNYAAKTLLGRMAKADDYQGALIFLASDASAYMTGANLVVDGGWTAI
jgi:NAD(P)-dependent dehydrogenase (short-subunit alcohol dehydrogenase family)